MPPPLGIGSPSLATRSLYLEPDEQLASARQPSATARLRTFPAPATRVTPRPIPSPRRNLTATRLVWRFRSPHHSRRESEMRTSQPKSHSLNKLLSVLRFRSSQTRVPQNCELRNRDTKRRRAKATVRSRPLGQPSRFYAHMAAG